MSRGGVNNEPKCAAGLTVEEIARARAEAMEQHRPITRAEFEALERRMTAMEGTHNDLARRVHEAEDEQSRQETRIEALEGDLHDAWGHLADLQDRVTGLEAEKERLDRALGIMQESWQRRVETIDREFQAHRAAMAEAIVGGVVPRGGTSREDAVFAAAWRAGFWVGIRSTGLERGQVERALARWVEGGRKTERDE